MKIRLILSRLLALLPLLVLPTGCSTRNPSTTARGLLWPFDEPSVDLYKYRDVQTRPFQDPKLAVAVSISGGGHRAANFAAGAFQGLEDYKYLDRSVNILKETDFFSTVSGGGFAAGAYISGLSDHLDNGGKPEDYSFEAAVSGKLPTVNGSMKRDLEVGFHNRLLRGLYHVASLSNYDRGDFLERALDQKILGSSYAARRGHRSLSMGDMFIPSDAPSHARVRLPFWIANATVYENGAHFPFTPDVLDYYGISGCTHLLKQLSFDPSDRGGTRYAQFPLAVGMKASASFPGAIPATTLSGNRDPRNKYLHLFDGGLSENLGILTAVRLLSQHRNSQKLLIVIDAYTGNHEPFSKTAGSPKILQILRRSTGIALDSSHQRHRDFLHRVAQSRGINIVTISFESLLKEPAESARAKELENLFATSRKVSTNLNVSPDVQDQLMKAGREAVLANKKELDGIVKRFLLK